MKKLLLFSFSLLIAVVVLAYEPVWQSAGDPMLNPGDEIDGMVITTGVADAPPLWAFCPPAPKNVGPFTVNCWVPLLPKLAIGHTFGLADPALQTLDWSALTWELSVDGQPVDLKAFGMYDFVLPGLVTNPSPIREVFRQIKAWDVVLTNPTPGLHTLHGVVRTGANTYTWAVNFTVEESLAS